MDSNMKEFVFIDKIRFYTDDLWETYKTSEVRLSEEYKSTDNKQLITKLKLEVRYGMKIADFLMSTLNNINKLIIKYKKLEEKELLNDGYGYAYEVFFVAIIHSKSFTEVINENIVYGSRDGVIDAVVKEGNDVFFYQIKSDQDLLLPQFKLLKKHVEEYEDNREITGKDNVDANEFCLKYIAEEKFNFFPITISKSDDDHNNYNVQDLICEFLHSSLIMNKIDNFSINIPITKEKNDKFYAKYENAYFVFVNIVVLFEAIFEELPKFDSEIHLINNLFGDNVRGYLGKNKSIVETIKEGDNENFYLYNNGISFCGTNVVMKGGIKFENPSIINGQQTFMTLYDLYKKPKMKDKLSKVVVPVFVKNLDEDDSLLKYKIANYTNKQRAVKEVDFLSIDAKLREMQSEVYQKTLLEFMKDKSNPIIFLKTISSGVNSKVAITNKIIDETGIINASDLIRLNLTINNPNQVHMYKNKRNYAYEKVKEEIIDKMTVVNVEKMCKVIRLFNLILENNKDNPLNIKKYNAANLVIQYMIYKGEKIGKTLKLIDDLYDLYGNDGTFVKLFSSSILTTEVLIIMSRSQTYCINKKYKK